MALKVADAAVTVLERSLASARGGTDTAHSPGRRSRHHLRTQATRGRPHRLDLGGKTDLQSRPRRDPSLSGGLHLRGRAEAPRLVVLPRGKGPTVPKTLPCGTVLSTAPLRVLAGNGTGVRLERVQWADSTEERPPLSKEDVMDGMTFGERYLRQGDLLGLREDQVDLLSRKEPLFRACGEHGHTGDTDTNRRNGRSHDA